jgi:glycosyl transferase family 2
MTSEGRQEVSLVQTASALRIAVLIPCYNEAVTIGKVVRDFKAELPDAEIYVFDNSSTDQTVDEAQRAGAIVQREHRLGKGYVLRSMFRQIEADVYVMVDGDDTYPADRVRDLIRPIINDEAEMVIGSRLLGGSSRGFKAPNLIGNQFFRILLNTLFRVQLTDLLSGYRALSRRVVKGLPFFSHGFECETELTVKCLQRGERVLEIPINLSARPPESHSKIHFLRDGFLILNTLLALARDYRPGFIFGSMGLILCAVGMIPGVTVVMEYIATGQILRLPSAVLAVGMIICGLLVGFVGLALHSISRHFQELDYQLQELLERQSRVSGHSSENRITANSVPPRTKLEE